MATIADERNRQRAAPAMVFDIDKESQALREEHAWRARGYAAKTIVKYPDLRVVLIAMATGARMREHHTAERISIHALSGHVRVHLESGPVDLPAGVLLALDRDVAHDVEATEASVVLLTLAFAKAGDELKSATAASTAPAVADDPSR